MWTLEQIWIYPIKSLPGVEVRQTVILPAGNLQHDREFALVDGDGRFMNAKRTAEVHPIRAAFDLDEWSVSLQASEQDTAVRFDLNADEPALSDWFSDYFKTSLRLVRQPSGGFPDDTEASGPTIISAATLQAIVSWFPGLSVDEVRRRFRANLVLEGGEAFSEDQMFSGPAEMVPIQIGSAKLWGNNPCQRCVVPTRGSASGELWVGFQKEFAKRREATLPATTNGARFNHFYRLAVNTVVLASEPQAIRAGDEVRLRHS